MTRKSGFTLIEILLAIFILSVVLTTVYAAYTGTARIIRDHEADAETYHLARNTIAVMVRDFGSICPYQGKFLFVSRRRDFDERKFTGLTFRSTQHIPFNSKDIPAGIATISYNFDVPTDPQRTGKSGLTIDRAGNSSPSLDRTFQSGADTRQGTQQNGGYLLLRSDSLYDDSNPNPDRLVGKSGQTQESSPAPITLKDTSMVMEKRGYVLCERLHSLNFRFTDQKGTEYDAWDSESDIQEQKNKAPSTVTVELKLINPANMEQPFSFMTRISLPVNEVIIEKKP